MCEKCFLKLSKQFKDLSEEMPEASHIMEDMSLLCFTASQFRHPLVSNAILAIATVAAQGSHEMAEVLMATTIACGTMLKEEDDESVHSAHGSI